jgi:hypothetical protein
MNKYEFLNSNYKMKEYLYKNVSNKLTLINKKSLGKIPEAFRFNLIL